MRKYIKLFEQFKNHQEIDSICRRYDIENYTINDDGSIDVDGNVNFYAENLKELPLRFRNINGYFECGQNNLTSLNGSPKEVRSHFSCTYNNLTSLEGAPSSVGEDFYCTSNKLISLKGAPSSVGGDFTCHRNQLISLEYAPSSVGGDFYCHDNYLTSLEYAPNSIGGNFYCHRNNIYSFEYFPDFVGEKIALPDNLEYILNLFDKNKELIYAFNDYNIIKAPKSSDDKPRLKLSNLNSFLSDNGFEELEDTSELSEYYELK